eukprot:MONOS_6962.1-p1 / transcript=MONOS_6962.1 / gene=MONOS_6962 / organism=Monocercomonoides_exilis_PA203 / gene_product=tetratricopeptide repeat domain containing protein / transcript_product=tetratricopeptide repeat domain containing protein / location=Mono_scaffold00229:16404-20526(+) / protein_length=1338 / sequence_SO=supercontig / SO=protein_coding / is_pseudo=false
MKAWIILLNDASSLSAYDVESSRRIFAFFLRIFPTAGKYWKNYIELEWREKKFEQVEIIFQQCLVHATYVPLWECYIRYITEIKHVSKPERVAAYEEALRQVGFDIYSKPLWKGYLSLLRQENEMQPHLAELIRKVYHRALSTPMVGGEEFKSQYEAWERSIDPKAAIPLLHECSHRFRLSNIHLNRRMTLAHGLAIAALPLKPMNTEAEKEQLFLWRRLIAFEESNPCGFDAITLRNRVSFTFRMALQPLFFFPSMWLMYAQFLITCGCLDDANTVFLRATEALPSTPLIAFAHVDMLETYGYLKPASEVLLRLIMRLSQQSTVPAVAVQHIRGLTLAFIQLQRFLKRTEGTEAARSVFVSSLKALAVQRPEKPTSDSDFALVELFEPSNKENPLIYLFFAAIEIEIYQNDSRRTARALYEMGEQEVFHYRNALFVTEHAKFLAEQIGDEEGARMVFEAFLAEREQTETEGELENIEETGKNDEKNNDESILGSIKMELDEKPIPIHSTLGTLTDSEEKSAQKLEKNSEQALPQRKRKPKSKENAFELLNVLSEYFALEKKLGNMEQMKRLQKKLSMAETAFKAREEKEKRKKELEKVAEEEEKDADESSSSMDIDSSSEDLSGADAVRNQSNQKKQKKSKKGKGATDKMRQIPSQDFEEGDADDEDAEHLLPSVGIGRRLVQQYQFMGLSPCSEEEFAMMDVSRMLRQRQKERKEQQRLIERMLRADGRENREGSEAKGGKDGKAKKDKKSGNKSDSEQSSSIFRSYSALSSASQSHSALLQCPSLAPFDPQSNSKRRVTVNDDGMWDWDAELTEAEEAWKRKNEGKKMIEIIDDEGDEEGGKDGLNLVMKEMQLLKSRGVLGSKYDSIKMDVEEIADKNKSKNKSKMSSEKGVQANAVDPISAVPFTIKSSTSFYSISCSVNTPFAVCAWSANALRQRIMNYTNPMPSSLVVYRPDLFTQHLNAVEEARKDKKTDPLTLQFPGQTETLEKLQQSKHASQTDKPDSQDSSSLAYRTPVPLNVTKSPSDATYSQKDVVTALQKAVVISGVVAQHPLQPPLIFPVSTYLLPSSSSSSSSSSSLSSSSPASESNSPASSNSPSSPSSSHASSHPITSIPDCAQRLLNVIPSFSSYCGAIPSPEMAMLCVLQTDLTRISQKLGEKNRESISSSSSSSASSSISSVSSAVKSSPADSISKEARSISSFPSATYSTSTSPSTLPVSSSSSTTSSAFALQNPASSPQTMLSAQARSLYLSGNSDRVSKDPIEISEVSAVQPARISTALPGYQPSDSQNTNRPLASPFTSSALSQPAATAGQIPKRTSFSRDFFPPFSKPPNSI